MDGGESSVVVGAGGAVYHGSRNSEGPPVLMKLGSENGPVLWTRGWQSKGPVDMVELGEKLFVLGWNVELQRVDAATGMNTWQPGGAQGQSYLVLKRGAQAAVETALEDMMVTGRGRPAKLTFHTA